MDEITEEVPEGVTFAFALCKQGETIMSFESARADADRIPKEWTMTEETKEEYKGLRKGNHVLEGGYLYAPIPNAAKTRAEHCVNERYKQELSARNKKQKQNFIEEKLEHEAVWTIAPKSVSLISKAKVLEHFQQSMCCVCVVCVMCMCHFQRVKRTLFGASTQKPTAVLPRASSAVKSSFCRRPYCVTRGMEETHSSSCAVCVHRFWPKSCCGWRCSALMSMV